MPKENINCISVDGLRVEVSWSHDKYVQLATVNQHSPFTFPRMIVDGAEVEPSEPFNGWHATLDRDGINRLIRSLRKARDAAFGADA